MVRYLISRGVDTSRKDRLGRTALDEARLHDVRDVVALLLKATS